MAENSPAYQLADYIHETFYNRTRVLTPMEVRRSRVTSGTSMKNRTERISVMGIADDRRVYQSLSKSTRTGHLYFKRKFMDTGEESRRHIPPHAPGEVVEVLEASLFADAIVQALEARNTQSTAPPQPEAPLS